jgi:hypothetical protein
VQVVDATRLGLACGNQRVAEEHQSGDGIRRERHRRLAGGEVRADAPAHRLAGEDEAIRVARHPFRRRGVAGEEGGRAVRTPPAGRHVRVIEGHHREAGGAEAVPHPGHERMVLPGACAVGEEDPGPPRIPGHGDPARDLVPVSPLDHDATRHGPEDIGGSVAVWTS